jgi:hypothetical protein
MFSGDGLSLSSIFGLAGGAERSRTADLLNAIPALRSQKGQENRTSLAVAGDHVTPM